MAKAKKGREINGVVLLDKDIGISSNHALQQVKRLFNAQKAGHSGSLDPLASGILPICLGQANKISRYLLADNKSYFVRGKLGQTTDTLDSEGQIMSEAPIKSITSAQIQKILKHFVGDIMQIPPMYSALKKNGQALYKLARQGIEIERKARPVRINKLDFDSYKQGILTLTIACSKGTYVRSLIDDIGNKLGCGAHVIELRRVGFAHIDISQTFKFAQMLALKKQNDAALDNILLKAEDLLLNFDNIYLNLAQSTEIKFGRKISINAKNSEEEEKTVKLFNEKRQFLGIGLIHKNSISVKRLFV